VTARSLYIGFIGAALALSQTAHAQSTDIRVKKPNVLLLLDNSGSMSGALNGANANFANNVGTKARWTILAETLTGTVNGLRVRTTTGTTLGGVSAGPYLESNGCTPFANLDPKISASLSTSGASGSRGPLTWPTVQGNPADKDAVAFCKTSDARCTAASQWGSATKCRQLEPGETNNGSDFSQVEDGLLDVFRDRVRFGLASFDSVPSLNESYWHSSSGLETWLNGQRASYGPLRFNGVGGATADMGFATPNVAPARGRLIGFGPAEWTLDSAFRHAADCTDEDSCTRLHNRMVEQAILGLSRHLNQNTPLAAMMRDAYEFLLFDTTTLGVHVPHRYDADVRSSPSLFGKIGPRNDPYFAAGARCRDSSVVLVTDGEPVSDLNENMSKYADLLLEEGIQTFVVAIGMDTATYNPTGSTSSVNNVRVDCAALTQADLGAGRVCERDVPGGTRWKYADVAPFRLSPGITAGAIRACCNLLETAVLGGTGRAYFPKNQSELKQRLGQMLNEIAGGAVSRTVPVTGGVAAAFASGGTTNAPAVAYELRSSMEVGGDGLWRGNLERLRYACDPNDFVADLTAMDPSRGDAFAANLATPGRDRRFFTVVPKEGDEVRGTLRASSLADGVAPGGNVGAFARLGGGTDSLVTVEALASAIDSAWASGANDTADLLGLRNSDANACLDELGTRDLRACASRVLRWFGGDANPDGGAEIATDPAPSRDPDSAQCRGDCSPLGAIYRSVPVFVPPPSPSDSDDQEYSKARVGGGGSFVEAYGARPTMLFSQTVDGQLHAFVVARNDFTPGGRFTSVPSGDRLENNELWTFIPPAVLPHLWTNFASHARVLDGQLAWANVVYDRVLSQENDSWSYDTVLVACSGVSVSGPFCYALEVTDPTAPRFLWQLGSAGTAQGKPGASLFGDYVPGAAITHLRVLDPADGKEHVKAVAVIPGGAMSVTPTGTERRRSASDLDALWASDATRRPRERIRAWGAGVPARSLTFVELATGRVLARMVGEMSDNPRLATQRSGDTQLARDAVVPPENTRFDSPITGIPVAYPGGTGAAQRLYVGDADGTLWRVELDGPKPEKWEAHIAFDAYNVGRSGDATLTDAWVGAGRGEGDKLGATLATPDATQAALLGQPIQNAPTLSTDPQGELVVVFATGDQESFQARSPGMVNLLVSFRDRWLPEKSDDGVRTTRYQAEVDGEGGVELAWLDGGRVTGHVNLFDGQLFFAYFMPSATNECTYGTGGLCAVHYVDKESSGAPVVSSSITGSRACTEFDQGEVVFGVTVALTPSCAVEESTFEDPYLAGSYSAVTKANPGRYELVFHTGQGGSASAQGTRTKRSSVALTTPVTRTTVRSFVRLADGEQ
jgi:type IV pilus assembly protein PilY1